MERINGFLNRRIDGVRQRIEFGRIARAERERRENFLNLERYSDFPHSQACLKEQGITVEAVGYYSTGAWSLPFYLSYVRCLDCRVRKNEGFFVQKKGDQQ